MLIEIKHRFTRNLLASVEATDYKAGLQILVAASTDLTGADLNASNLAGAYLRGARFQNANMHGCNVRGANLQGADLRDVDLQMADLREALLQNANLTSADLREADLGGANVDGANVTNILLIRASVGLRALDPVIPSSTFAALPSPGTPGRVRRLTDRDRGEVIDEGTLWASLGQQVYDVQKFGMHPSFSAATNTAAWNSLMNTIPSSSSSGTPIVFPPGIYQTQGLVLTDKFNVSIFTYGRPGIYGNASLVCTDMATDSLTIIRGGQIGVAGLYVGHGGKSNSGKAAIKAQGVPKLSITDVATQNYPSQQGSQNGIIIEASIAPFEAFLTWLTRCICSDHTENGIVLSGSASNRRTIETLISECAVMANIGAGLTIKDYVAGIYIRNGTNIAGNGRSLDIVTTVNDGRTLDLYLSDCILDAPTFENIRAQNINSVHIHNNWISSAGGVSGNVVWGIDQLTGTSTGWEVKGNFIAFNRGGGMRFAGDHSMITNNYFSTNGGLAATPTALSLLATSNNNDANNNKYLGHTVDINDLGTNNALGPRLG